MADAGTITVKVVPDVDGFADLLRDALADALEELASDIRRKGE
jgi:hypothetical protein